MADEPAVRTRIPEGMMPSDEPTVRVLGLEVDSWWHRLSVAQRITVYGLALDAYPGAGT